MSAKRKVKRSNSLESLRELYKLRSQENKQSKRENDGCKEDGSKNNTANVTLGIKELYGNKTMDPDGTNKDTSKKGESPSKAELTWGNIMKFQVKSLKRRTIKRRATLADIRYIDVLKPIPESEEESDAESPFPLFRQSSKSTTTLTSPRFKYSKDSLEYEMRPRKTMEESSEKENSVVEANASYQGLHHEESSMGTSDFSSFECNHIFDQYLETISDEDEMSSSYSDDNSETLELKKAVSNYELSYDVDDNENVNIMERLNKTIPDTASECDTDSLRSQSPTTAEDLYETLYTLGDTFTPRRRSYSLDAALSLPSISEERRRSSTFSTMSDASVFSNDVFLIQSKIPSRKPSFEETQDVTPAGGKGVNVSKHRSSTSENEIESGTQSRIRFLSNALASKLLRIRNATSFENKDPSIKAQTFPESNTEKQQTETQGNDVPDKMSGNSPSSTQTSIQTKNLVKALKQKVRATLRRRNSIASSKPWTGAVERSLRTSFDLLQGSKNVEDEDPEEKVNDSLLDHNVTPMDVHIKTERLQEEKTTATSDTVVTKDDITSPSSSNNSKLGKQGQEQSKTENKRSHTESGTLVKSVAKSSRKDQRKGENKNKNESNPTMQRTSTTIEKKAPAKKSFSLSSITNKNTPTPKPLTNNDVAKRPPSPTLRNKKKATPSPKLPSKPLRFQTPVKNIQETKKSGVELKVVSVKPQKPLSSVSSKERNSKMTVKSAQVSKNLLPEKNKKVAKEGLKSSKTSSIKARTNPSSDLAKLSKKDLNTSSINLKDSRDAKSVSPKSPNVQVDAKESTPSQSGSKTISPNVQASNMEKIKNATSVTLTKITNDAMLTKSKKPENKAKNEENLSVSNLSPNFSEKSARSVEGNKQAKDDTTPVRKTSVNVIRRPLSPFTITIPYSPKTNEEDKKPTNTSGQKSNNTATENQITQSPGKLYNKSSTTSPNKSTLNGDLEKELENFSFMLGEIENSPSDPVLSAKTSCRDEPDTKASEVVPTDKRFAALSERYNAIMSKFKPANIITSKDSSREKKPEKHFDDAKSKEKGLTKPSIVVDACAESANTSASKLRDAITADKEMTNISGVNLDETVENRTVASSNPSNFPNSETVLLSENATPLFSQSAPQASFLFASADDNLREQNVTKTQAIVPKKSFQDNETLIKISNSSDTANGRQAKAAPEKIQKSNQERSNDGKVNGEENKGFVIKKHGTQEKTTDAPIERVRSGSSEKFQELKIRNSISTNVEIKPQYANEENGILERTSEMHLERTRSVSSCSEKVHEESSMQRANKEKGVLPRKTNLSGQRERSMTSSPEGNIVNTPHRRTFSFTSRGRKDSHLAAGRSSFTSVERQGSLSLVDKLVPSRHKREHHTSERTTVIAQLINRKFGPRRKQSIEPAVIVRKSRVFKDSEVEIQKIPSNMEQFNKYRSHLEIIKLKTTVKTEALSIHDVLSSLNSSLMEMELIALCKECTKTLRTLDALGSLPPYLSPDTVIVNPSGTIKFKHLSTEVKIDDLLLAPEHTKKYSLSEKTCVFSLAVTLWLAADWKLTETQKPSLSQPFQELLVSMSNDSSTERPSFDSILQTCELLHTDEMTSRERCQALLWECRATKVLDKQNTDENSNEESNKTKAQHAALMGSVSVAANFKGFLKHTEPPTERNISVKTPKHSGVINEPTISSKPLSKDERKIMSKTPQNYEMKEQYEHRNPKPPSPSLNAFIHQHPAMDPNMVFSPINHVSGNPHLSMNALPSGDMAFRNQSQAPAPTFVPIAVPVPAAGPTPMWYMTPSGMVPFSQMGHHPGYFVPLHHGSASSTVSDSDMSELEDLNTKHVRRSPRPSTPTRSEKGDGHSESKRSTTSSSKSRIPRPVWNSQKPSSARPHSPSTRTSKVDTPSNRGEYSRNDTSSKPSSPYRSNTPPTRLRSGSTELERETRRSRSASLGPPSPRSDEVTPRASSPRLERSRPSSPSFSGAHSESRPISPGGSRSSSPVSMLISKFEDLSSESKPSDSLQSVSNLLNKFGSSSLLSEDRITKRHFRTSSAHLRSGPLRPASALDQTSNSMVAFDTDISLSRSWSGQTTGHSDTSYSSNDYVQSSPGKSPLSENTTHRKYSDSRQQDYDTDSSGNARDESYEDSLIGQTRNRLSSSLENLYGSLKDLDRKQRDSASLRRNWTSVENVYRESNESLSENTSNSLKKYSSAENLTSHRLNRDNDAPTEGRSSPRNEFTDRNRGQKSYMMHEKSRETVRGSERTHHKSDSVFKTTYDKDITNLFGQFESKSNVINSASVREMTTSTSFMAPERDYQLDYRKELSSSLARNPFEIPVALAVMDGEGERLGASSFSPNMSSVKDKGIFQHPIKLEKDPTSESPPAPLSPSVKDCKPTSYFTNLSFSNKEMKPERDTGLAHASNQNRWNEKPSKKSYNSDTLSSDSRLYDGDTKTDKENSNSTKNKHSSSTGSTSERHIGFRGSDSSKLSSDGEYLERFERRLSRASSISEEDPDNLGSDHHFKAVCSSTHKTKNDEAQSARTTNAQRSSERGNEKQSPAKPNPLSPTNSFSPVQSLNTTVPRTSKTKPSSVPNTPTATPSGSTSTPLESNASKTPSTKSKSTSVPSTPNSTTKTPPFFKYVNPNSSPRKTSSSKPPSTEPSPNVEKPSHTSPTTAKSNMFDFSERTLKDKVDFRRSSFSSDFKPDLRNITELTSAKAPTEFPNPMSPTEPRSPTSPVSSSSSAASSPSLRFPVNKYMFYNPQNEAAVERHLSPTEQVTSSGQKGFVITDTSRQKKPQKKEPKVEKTKGHHTTGKVTTETQSHKESAKREQQTQRGGPKSTDGAYKATKKESQRLDVNRNIISKSERKEELVEAKATKQVETSIRESASTSRLNDKNDTKDTKDTIENRRASIDLREIYHQARRSSLVETNTIRPQRPPSPGRVDSRELLGHFVKKVLNSAVAKHAANTPTTSHADLSYQQNKEPIVSNIMSSTSPHTKENVDYATRERKTSQERKVRKVSADNQKQRASLERKQQAPVQEKIEVVKTQKRNPSLEEKQPAIVQERVHVQERRASLEKKQQVVQERIIANSAAQTNAASKDDNTDLQDSIDRRTSLESSGEKHILAELIDMIHDEFAFDGYLDDGVEDVNMAEYVISLTGMSEAMFKESISDQYSDLYWDEDLLQDMFLLVNKTLTTRRPTLRFSESTVSDISRPGSVISTDSHQDLDSSFNFKSISRTSSERSFVETRDYVMSSLGEPSQFLPFRIIAPEIMRDVIDELGPVFEDYYKVMKLTLSPCITELLEKLGAKILEIGQQLTLERRAKRKNIASFNKVADLDNKKDVKDLANKLLQEVEESDKKIIYLKYIQRRLRNIYAERFGLDHSLLNSFVKSYGETSIILEPKRQNSFLSFSPLWDQRGSQSAECHGESTRGPVLQYGTASGLLSYLFARNSMSQAFVRYFLYTYRYCATPNEMFEFIRDKCRASLRADTDKTYNHQLQIRYRALDLLAEWAHCCYQFDLKTNPDLLQRLLVFLNEELVPVDRTERGTILIELIAEKQRKDNDKQTDETTDATAVLQTDENQGSSTEKDSLRKNKRKHKSPVQCFKRGSPQASSMYKPTLHLKSMSVIDHSSRTIAEQLTLIQQDTFARVHSIHFLNSRTLGVGVGRSSPTKETSQQDNMLGFNAGRRRSLSGALSLNDPQPKMLDENNLFEGEPITDGYLETLLMHAQDVSMWIAVEICSAPSAKNQQVLIQKYISVAKYCVEMRNFATCIQVVDALEMFVVRQLPVWKQIPNKLIQTLEELKAIKVLLKTDSAWLLKDKAHRERPTIPCTLLFLMQVQQLELGGFTLANGMFKWTKMRSIARLVDQIRLFKQMRYAFEANDELAYRLRARILECREENLHALAAENSTNFHLSSSQSSRKFQEAFKKMKATFGNG